TGFTIWKVAVYSTMPRALRGASLMSWMTALCGSLGSSSPNAFPASVSYWPAALKLAPSKAGETFFSIAMRVTRACAVAVAARMRPTAVRQVVDVRRALESLCWVLSIGSSLMCKASRPRSVLDVALLSIRALNDFIGISVRRVGKIASPSDQRFLASPQFCPRVNREVGPRGHRALAAGCECIELSNGRDAHPTLTLTCPSDPVPWRGSLCDRAPPAPSNKASACRGRRMPHWRPGDRL